MALEESVPLSQSLVWGLQRSFYEQKGISAWGEKIVPNYVTTNPWIAKAYTNVIAAFLQDLWISRLDPTYSKLPRLRTEEPIYILELGAGSGRLGFFIVKHLKRLRERMGFIGKMRICYVMTDFAQSNVDFWLKHPRLQPYFNEGILDCAIFDAQKPYDDIILRKSGRRISQGSCVNPIITIANYFFCVVQQDAFMVDESGALTEGLVTSRSTRGKEEDLTDIEMIPHVRRKFSQVPISSDTRYADKYPPEFTTVLQEYHDYFKNKSLESSFLMPVGAMLCLDGIMQKCRNHHCMLCVSSDKGYNHVSEFEGRIGYPMSIEGSFSFMANMDAFEKYARAKGGSFLPIPVKLEGQGDTCLATSTFLFEGKLEELPFTGNAIEENLRNFGPVDFYQLVHAMTVYESGATPSGPVVDNNPENRYWDNSELVQTQEEEIRDQINDETKDQNEESPSDNHEENTQDQTQANALIRDAEHCDYSLQQILAIWRLSDFDPYVFWQTKAKLLHLNKDLYDEEKKEVEKSILATIDNFFNIGEGDDLPFELGRTAYQLQISPHTLALGLYQESLRMFGDHYITYFNIALCHSEMDQFEDAQKNLEKCLELDPEYDQAEALLREIEAKLHPGNVLDLDTNVGLKTIDAAKRLSQLHLSNA